ncbi:MAG: hypothetical protein ACRD0P_02495 [Stackebrandtia sp.]
MTTQQPDDATPPPAPADEAGAAEPARANAETPPEAEAVTPGPAPSPPDGQHGAGEPESAPPAAGPSDTPQAEPPLEAASSDTPQAGPPSGLSGQSVTGAADVPATGDPADDQQLDGTEPVADTGGAMPIPRPPVSRPPAGSAYGYPTRYAEAPGTGHFQLALPQLGTIVAGPAAGSMIAGIAAVMAAFSVGCTGVFDSIMVPVAATVLVVFCIGTAGLLAGVALRQIKRGGGEYRGKGMAVAGLACGGGALFVLLFMLLILSISWS